MPENALQTLIDFYQTLTPESVDRFANHYSQDAWFKDPFNEVQGLAAIERIFTHMFRQVDAPRFVVSERFESPDGAMLIWAFHYRFRWPLPMSACDQAQVMHGVSHLRFGADGRVNYHRDYWDTGGELYAKLPGLGWVARGMRRALSA